MGLTMRELCPNGGMAGEDATMTDPVQWFALAVRHQHERQTERLLKFKGLETLAPSYRTERSWSDRVKEIELPLFAGYIFCRFSTVEKIRVMNTPGVVKVVGFGGSPMPVHGHEIREIQRLAESGLSLRPWPYLKAGDRVRVERGPLRGIEGTLLREKDGARLVVGVELLQRAVAVELAADMIVPLSSCQFASRFAVPV
jgi:transcription termination/antitermination protein NusG